MMAPMDDKPERPQVEWTTTTTPAGEPVSRSGHPPGVECDFTTGQCSCGRLGTGLIVDEMSMDAGTDWRAKLQADWDAGRGIHLEAGTYVDRPEDAEDAPLTAYPASIIQHGPYVAGPDRLVEIPAEFGQGGAWTFYVNGGQGIPLAFDLTDTTCRVTAPAPGDQIRAVEVRP